MMSEMQNPEARSQKPEATRQRTHGRLLIAGAEGDLQNLRWRLVMTQSRCRARFATRTKKTLAFGGRRGLLYLVAKTKAGVGVSFRIVPVGKTWR